MNPLAFLNKLSPFDVEPPPGGALTHRSFFMKDLYTDGLWAVKRQRRPDTALMNSMEIVEGYKILDTTEDEETGRPYRDYFVWFALAQLMLAAGDLVNTSIQVEHRYSPGKGLIEGGAWRFGFALPTTLSVNGTSTEYRRHPFLSLYPVDTATVTEAFLSEQLLGPTDENGESPYKAMGSIDATHLFVKMGSYPMAVHPGLKNRSVATQLPYILVGMLVERTALHVLQHWQPEDTSANPGVYLLSDGFDTYLMVYDAPALRDCLIRIDAAVGRTEEDGAIVADPTVQFAPVAPMDPAAEPAPLTRPVHDAERDRQDDPLDDTPVHGDELPV